MAIICPIHRCDPDDCFETHQQQELRQKEYRRLIKRRFTLQLEIAKLDKEMQLLRRKLQRGY